MSLSSPHEIHEEPAPHSTALPDSRKGWVRPALALVGVAVSVLVAWLGVDSPIVARSVLIAGVCLTLWLTELVPPFVPTLLLLGATPALLGAQGPGYTLPSVLGWCADPVLALFLGGFTLEVAASRHGLDAMVAQHVVRLARGSQRLLMLLVIGGVAFLSMWMSNIAAAAMMLAALRPLLQSSPEGSALRRALLLSVALGANFGGMATPVGSGPNAIAISAASPHAQVTFVKWMAFALPLTGLMLAVGYALLVVGYRVRGRFEPPTASAKKLTPQAHQVLGIFIACAALWLTEPLHGLPAPIVALGATVALFGTGLLRREDLGRIDWSTLILIAGGIALGRLVERSGVVATALGGVDWSAWPQVAQVGLLVALAAVLSALMSNTGTSALLIPISLQLFPSASIPVLVAMGCSFGIPFVISTPPNAMVAGEGGVESSDMMRLGLPLMALGCLVITLTGPWVLRLFGLP
ncbi:SLC13 family permease [Hyalangium rubrum]|uniref:DASS family sodium-coupled anion symporter n=1 Tax=Hyalangium rubrum TaxID=3103134 RepID=A0ABU5H444_9BACT|nr:DASS family sodium-coupled anion symporter [Hyalangium sp. s54d21]MDY7228228.1 DASS family sodium-coupled anion symporter [Hyalangium sp. s54d21]